MLKQRYIEINCNKRFKYTRKFMYLHDTCSSRKCFLAVKKIFSCLQSPNPLTNSEKFETVHIRLKSKNLDELKKFSEFQEKWFKLRREKISWYHGTWIIAMYGFACNKIHSIEFLVMICMLFFLPQFFVTLQGNHVSLRFYKISI